MALCVKIGGSGWHIKLGTVKIGDDYLDGTPGQTQFGPGSSHRGKSPQQRFATEVTVFEGANATKVHLPHDALAALLN